MRFLWFPTLVMLLAQTPNACADEDWRLVWSDEFNGEALDYSKWEIEINAFGGGNHELQIYTDRSKNVRVADGHLVLEAHRDNHGIAGTVREFSSGRIRSKRRGDWKYAKVVFRAKLPAGQGLWPAIWLMPSDDVYGTWAASGEIDIVELKGQEPDQIWAALHYGAVWPDNDKSDKTYKLPAGQSFSDSFHDFTFEWEEGVMRWYVGDRLWHTEKKWHTTEAPFPAPFDQPFHLVLNIAVGGQFVGNPSPDTPFPARMLVDYIRVYQR